MSINLDENEPDIWNQTNEMTRTLFQGSANIQPKLTFF